MKTKLNNVALPVISVLSLFLIFSAGVLIFSEINYLYYFSFVRRYLVYFIIGLIYVVGLCFIKEKWMYKAALPIYLIVIAVLVTQLFLKVDYNNYNYTERFINFGFIYIYSAGILPLCALQSAKRISKSSDFGMFELIKILAVVLLPILLVFCQNNYVPVVLALAVCLIVLVKMKMDKRIKLPWVFLILPIAIILIIFCFMVWNEGNFQDRIAVILTRGKSDSYGLGWQRILLDRIFKTSSLFNGTDILIGDNVPASKIVLGWDEHNLVVLLAKNGWVLFISVLLVYAVLHTSLFMMVKKINQSPFAKILSFSCAVILLVQSAFSLIGLFFLTSAKNEMPFSSLSRTIIIANFIMFGIVFSLYIRRNKIDKQDGSNKNKWWKKLTIYKLLHFEEYLEENDEETFISEEYDLRDEENLLLLQLISGNLNFIVKDLNYLVAASKNRDEAKDEIETDGESGSESSAEEKKASEAAAPDTEQSVPETEAESESEAAAPESEESESETQTEPGDDEDKADYYETRKEIVQSYCEKMKIISENLEYLIEKSKKQ